MNRTNELVEEVRDNIGEYLDAISVEDEYQINIDDVYECVDKLKDTFYILSNDKEYAGLVEDFCKALSEDGANFSTSGKFLKTTFKLLKDLVGDSENIVEDRNYFDLLMVNISEVKRLQRPEMMKKLIAVIVNVVDKNYDAVNSKIEEETKKTEYNFVEFCENIIKESDIKTDITEKKFMPVIWYDSIENKAYRIGDAEGIGSSDIAEFDYSDRSIRLVGPAGEGKTWAMKYLQYKCCKEYIDNNGAGNTFAAVLIELKKFNDAEYRDKTIYDLLMDKLKIDDRRKLDRVMETGKIKLFLDGYNEILSESVRTNVNNFIDENDSYSYIVSDRDSSTSIFRFFKTYSLKALDKEQIEWYFNKYLGEASSSEIKGNEKLKWIYEERIAPYMLEVFAVLAKKRIYPAKNEFDKEYLKLLLKREVLQKTTDQVYLLNKWLKKVAKKMKDIGEQNYNISIDDAEEILKDVVSDKSNPAIINNFEIWANDIPLFGMGEGDYMKFNRNTYRDYYADNSIIDNFGRVVD